ncbi:neural Wiskott-Aldrich syndrome protein-like [Teleopsis dalmanni]|uniref:neural Wiskott-Aldrich syndrome protein-like n=1 Tax=Teleopsis dalmanni TaxID=139649 RepID=UPI0018CDEACC|nr:neural Wiskott-Aldrich syndrome protein-like [Teleopsis dalmanni]
MANKFISEPSNFKYMEGFSVDFRKTFDLNGTNNDETLRLYLRKAGLSDQIEYLTPEQRRAFIYDIIKSNKMPGYWVPSTMNTSSFAGNAPAAPPPPPPSQITAPSPTLSQKFNTPGTPTIHYATISTSSSSNSLESAAQESPILPNRFSRKPAPQTPSPENPVLTNRFSKAPITPPSPTTFVTNSRNNKYEISSPINFRHVSGDMTRDMTRNAFDLSKTSNDNVLKKYMIERGITEEDLMGMRKPDIIRNIVQSKYTWMPPNKKELNYIFEPVPQTEVSTTSFIEEAVDVEETVTISAPKLTEPVMQGNYSNFDHIATKFMDPSEFPSPDTIFGNNSETEDVIMFKKDKTVTATPPPPSSITATPHSNEIYHTIKEPPKQQVIETIKFTPATIDPIYATVRHQQTLSKPPPPPPPPKPLSTKFSDDTFISSTTNANPNHTDNHSRDALLESIRLGVTLNKSSPKERNTIKTNTFTPPVNVQNKSTVSSNKPIAAIQKQSDPIKRYSAAPIPPPPKPQESNATGAPPPPPPPAGVPPPPPPPALSLPQTNLAATSKSTTTTAVNDGDSRDAFLESIRKGVTLKKVNQKAATVSAAATRPTEKKPPVTDFLSELKMGITLRRNKNLNNDPHATDEPDESNA